MLQEGYAETYQELLDTTIWEDYGVASGNPKCANCMVSCGYEPSAVIEGFGSLRGFLAMVRGSFSNYRDPHALKLLNDFASQQAAPRANLVQIAEPAPVFEETRA